VIRDDTTDIMNTVQPTKITSPCTLIDHTEVGRECESEGGERRGENIENRNRKGLTSPLNSPTSIFGNISLASSE
jgi:hypothetical protein